MFFFFEYRHLKINVLGIKVRLNVLNLFSSFYLSMGIVYKCVFQNLINLEISMPDLLKTKIKNIIKQTKL